MQISIARTDLSREDRVRGLDIEITRVKDSLGDTHLDDPTREALKVHLTELVAERHSIGG
jgi:hypothetical protein